MILVVMSEEKALICQDQDYFSVLSSVYGKPHNFQEACHNKHPE